MKHADKLPAHALRCGAHELDHPLSSVSCGAAFGVLPFTWLFLWQGRICSSNLLLHWA